MRRDLATSPAPDLQQASVEIRVLLQRRDVEENVSLISRRAKRNQTSRRFTEDVLIYFRTAVEEQIKA